MLPFCHQQACSVVLKYGFERDLHTKSMFSVQSMDWNVHATILIKTADLDHSGTVSAWPQELMFICCVKLEGCKLLDEKFLHLPLFSLYFLEGKTKREKGIQRSTETGMAVELSRNMSRQPSRESNNGSMNSCNSEGK